MSMLRRLGRQLLDVIWPEDACCLLCGRFTRGERLCADCASALENLRYPLPPPGAAQWSAWPHEQAARRLVHLLKYENTAAAAQIMAVHMAQIARAMRLPPDTTVTWVTMPERRRRERGIDHGRILAEAVAQQLDLPAKALLVRTGDGRTQRGLNRAERLRNLTGSFVCKGAAGHILLVDDVTTTGATAQICADALLQAGARQVTVITASRAEKKSFMKRQTAAHIEQDDAATAQRKETIPSCMKEG